MRWDEMTMRQKADVIQMYIRHGITDLNEIRRDWDHSFGEGGSVDTVEEDPEQHPLVRAARRGEHVKDREVDYDNQYLSPDERGHSTDWGKLPPHPTFSKESLHPLAKLLGGEWGPGYRTFEMSDWQMTNPNNTVFGLYEQGDGAVAPTYRGAVVLPEITVTPNGSYVYDGYRGDRLYYGWGGYLPAFNPPVAHVYGPGGATGKVPSWYKMPTVPGTTPETSQTITYSLVEDEARKGAVRKV